MSKTIYFSSVILSLLFLFYIIATRQDPTKEMKNIQGDKLVENSYFVKNKLDEISVKVFLPKRINKNFIYTYYIEDENTSISIKKNIPSKNKIFYLTINSLKTELDFTNNKSKKVPIPKIDKINTDLFYTQNKIKSCEITTYHTNVYYFNALRTKMDIFCKSEDQKTTISIFLIENIGIIYFDITRTNNGKFNTIYKVDLFSIKDSDKLIEGKDLYTPDYIKID